MMGFTMRRPRTTSSLPRPGKILVQHQIIAYFRRNFVDEGGWIFWGGRHGLERGCGGASAERRVHALRSDFRHIERTHTLKRP